MEVGSTTEASEAGQDHGRLRRRIAVVYYVLAVSLFALWGAVGLYTALDHNPQGEFCAYVEDSRDANWTVHGNPCHLQWSAIGGMWLVVLIVATPCLLLPLPFLLYAGTRRRAEKPWLREQG